MNKLAHLKIPRAAQPAAYAVIEHTDSFCGQYLDNEYAELCRRVVARLGRKRPTPLGRGDLKTWAAAVICAIGSINFLFDRTQRPHLTTDQLGNQMGVSKSTMVNKAKVVRDLLHIRQFDPELTRQQLLADLPMAWLIDVGGILMDARMLPPATQEEAHRLGLIPDPSLARSQPPG